MIWYNCMGYRDTTTSTNVRVTTYAVQETEEDDAWVIARFWEGPRPHWEMAGDSKNFPIGIVGDIGGWVVCSEPALTNAGNYARAFMALRKDWDYPIERGAT